MSYNTNNVWIESVNGFIRFTQTGILNTQIRPTYLVLAEGDSWFHIGGNTGFGSVRNLIDGFNFNNHHTLICNLALSGDTISNMANTISSQDFFKILKTYQWNAIMLSGGGNDLIDALAGGTYKYKGKGISILKANSAPSGFMDHISEQDLQLLCQAIADHFQKLFDYKLTTQNAAAPVFIHVYDYPTPRNAPAKLFKFRKGPWLYKALVGLNISPVYWQAITNYIFDAVATKILAFNGTQNVHVIDTRNTITMALANTTGDSGDWLNEIHPNKNGIKKLSDKINMTLVNFF